MKRAVLGTVIFLLSACRRDGFRIVERGSEDTFWVKVVLEYKGHKYYTKCNNYKADGPGDRHTGCTLHVGQEPRCQFFPDSSSPDAGGYHFNLW